MAASIAHEALPLPLPWGYEIARERLDTVWEDLITEADGADIAKKALEPAQEKGKIRGIHNC